jgi:hypothetical protein
MADVTVSSLTQQNANVTTFIYGITNSSTDGKVAVGAINGIPYFDGSGNINPVVNVTGSIGLNSKRFVSVFLSGTGALNFQGSTANQNNAYQYTHGTGPVFKDVTTGFTTIWNVQSQTANHTLTIPNMDGTVGLFGDTQNFTPSSGDTVSPTATSAEISVFVNPAGLIAALTVALPSGIIPGQVIYLTFTQVITALTVSGSIGTQGLGAATAASATTTIAYAWSASGSAWNRRQ